MLISSLFRAKGERLKGDVLSWGLIVASRLDASKLLFFSKILFFKCISQTLLSKNTQNRDKVLLGSKEFHTLGTRKPKGFI